MQGMVAQSDVGRIGQGWQCAHDVNGWVSICNGSWRLMQLGGRLVVRGDEREAACSVSVCCAGACVSLACNKALVGDRRQTKQSRC